ncbi:MAG: hypothetical protein LBE47_03530, partial [Methanomassiliicoccaceae archaeon]|nr:hypothetical protein [Methanomassiliicoccaceae archaeon]
MRTFSILFVTFVLLASTVMGAVSFNERGSDHGFNGNDVVGATTWDGKPATSLSGSGTLASPYLIGTPADLLFMSNKVNEGNASYVSAHYRLTEDIVYNDLAHYNIWGEGFAPRYKWTPIGTQT